MQKDFKKLKKNFHKVVYELGGHIEEKSANRSSGKQVIIYLNADRSKHFMVSWHTSYSDKRALLILRSDIIRGCLSVGWHDIRAFSFRRGANPEDAATSIERIKREDALRELWVELHSFFGADEVVREVKSIRKEKQKDRIDQKIMKELGLSLNEITDQIREDYKDRNRWVI